MLIFIIIWSLWFISEIFLNRFLRSGNRDKKDQDKGTISMIWITVILAVSFGIIADIFFHVPIGNLLIIPYSGLILIVLGMVLRFISVLSLGRLFTVDVTIRDHHKIKKGGVYRLIRHPSYSGSLLSFIGFGISLNNWISLIIITTLVTIAMLYRIKIEERLLMDQFGFEYLDYTKKTYRLIPWIY
jgi:protein-S-isoprenylcysteine O-methyltransferase Ste14